MAASLPRVGPPGDRWETTPSVEQAGAFHVTVMALGDHDRDQVDQNLGWLGGGKGDTCGFAYTRDRFHIEFWWPGEGPAGALVLDTPLSLTVQATSPLPGPLTVPVTHAEVAVGAIPPDGEFWEWECQTVRLPFPVEAPTTLQVNLPEAPLAGGAWGLLSVQWRLMAGPVVVNQTDGAKDGNPATWAYYVTT